MRSAAIASESGLQSWATVIAIALLSGGAFYIGSSYQQSTLQGYEAILKAPLTARSDIMPIYSKAPFQKLEIEFPSGEIAEKFVLRVWVDKDRSPLQVEADIKQYLDRFYATSQTLIDMRLSSIELEISSLEAEQQAKIFEMNYLREHYAQLRAQRIDRLSDEVRALGATISEKRVVTMLAKQRNGVNIQNILAIAPRNLVTSRILQSILVGFFVGLLQLLWVQRKRSVHEGK